MGFLSSIASTLTAGGLNLVGGERANAARRSEARKNRHFQERLANSAHQREVRDLRKAGLNPILSAKYGGAATPAGSVAHVEDTISNAVSGAMTARQVKATTQNLEEDTSLKREQANVAAQTNELVKEQTRREQATANRQEFDNVRAGLEAELYDSAVGEGKVVLDWLKNLGVKVPVKKAKKVTPDSKKITQKDVKNHIDKTRKKRKQGQSHEKAYPHLYHPM